jgi:hypothetical protein
VTFPVQVVSGESNALKFHLYVLTHQHKFAIKFKTQRSKSRAIADLKLFVSMLKATYYSDKAEWR